MGPDLYRILLCRNDEALVVGDFVTRLHGRCLIGNEEVQCQCLMNSIEPVCSWSASVFATRCALYFLLSYTFILWCTEINS